MLKVLELFGGIGSPRKALQRLNIDFEVVDYVDIDKYATQSYNGIFNENYIPCDVCDWDKSIDVDLIFHGSPCQDFSLAGKQAGGDLGTGTRSSLMYETLRIVKKLKPRYVIWENVKNVLSKKHIHNFENYLDTLGELGYTNYYRVLNAKDFGIPQNRERVFVISILGEHQPYVFPQKQELKLKLKDILETDVDKKYYLSDEIVRKYRVFDTDTKHQVGSIYEENGLSPTLDTMQRQPCIEVKVANKKGYDIAIEGDSINLEQPNSKTRRGRVGKQVAQTLNTGCNQAVVINNSYVRSFRSRGKLQDDICDTVTPAIGNTKHNLQIRKLTALECWRLMGFDSLDFYNAQKTGVSNTQLYKQAGNSIVVNVLVELFRELFKKEEMKQ